MWTMWTCTPAFRNVAMPQLSYLVVHERQRLPIPSGMDPRYAALMTRCWEHEPALRCALQCSAGGCALGACMHAGEGGAPGGLSSGEAWSTQGERARLSRPGFFSAHSLQAPF